MPILGSPCRNQPVTVRDTFGIVFGSTVLLSLGVPFRCAAPHAMTCSVVKHEQQKEPPWAAEYLLTFRTCKFLMLSLEGMMR